MRHVIEGDVFADDGSAPAEVLLPQQMAQDHRGLRARRRVFRVKGPAEQRRHTEDVKVILSDEAVRQLRRLLHPREIGVIVARRGHVLERGDLLFELPETCRGEGHAFQVLLEILLLDEMDAIRLREWEGREQNSMDHTEDGGVGPNPERERDYRDEGKAGSFAKLAKSKAEIVHKISIRRVTRPVD